MKKIILLFFVLFCLIKNYGQTSFTKQLDSIHQLVKNQAIEKVAVKNIYSFLGKNRYPKQSKTILTLIFEKFKASNANDLALANASYALSNYYFFNAKTDSCFYYIKKAETYIEKADAPLLKSSILMTKGGVLKREGKVVIANNEFLAALKILKNLDTLKLAATENKKRKGKLLILYNSLAIFNKENNDFDAAINYYNKAFNITEEMKAPRYGAIILSNEGDLYIQKKQYKKALAVLEKSKKLRLSIDKNSISATDLNLALVHTALKNYDKALHLFNTIIPYFKKHNTNHYMESLIARGKLYLAIKEYKKSIADCKTGYQLSLQQKNLKYQNLSSKYLYKAYKNIKKYKNAFYYLEKHKKYQDSIFNKNNIKQITQMQMRYQFDSENERKEIQKQAEKKAYKRVIYSLLLGLFAFFISSVLSYRLYHIRQKNNVILKGKNKQIAKALKDNKILLKETHHRVKNSLQMISSLLYLQSENITDEKAASSVKDGQIRVKSMALIHQKLYQNNHLTGVEVSDYIHDLATDIFQSHHVTDEEINLDIAVEKMILDIDTITPIGIIINELIVNALKHAFDKKGKKATISIKLFKEKEALILQVNDNGSGFKPKEKKEKSFGMKLIKSLSRKLKATLSITHKNGTEITLHIKRFKIM